MLPPQRMSLGEVTFKVLVRPRPTVKLTMCCQFAGSLCGLKNCCAAVPVRFGTEVLSDDLELLDPES